ncbi:MAG: hypothetical protein R3F14_46090 [Polyangiaceae bacterium]
MRYQPTQPAGEAAAAESDILSFTTAETTEVVVAAIPGEFAACDVWFRGPDTWLSPSHAVVVRLYARQSGARVLIGQANLRDVLHTEDSGGATSAWVFSARGIPCQGFEVTSQRGSGGVAISGGQFFLRARTAADRPAVQGAGGVDGLRAVSVSNVVQVQPVAAVTVTQPAPSALLATVSQSTPSALQTTSAQGVAASAAGRWPVYLSDGSTALGTTTAPLYVGRIRDGAATFAATCGYVGTGTAVATKSIGYLWHPSSSSKRVEIRRISISHAGGSGAGPVLFRAVRISNVSGSPGGSALTATSLDLSDTSSLTVVSGATTAPARQSPSQADLFAFITSPSTPSSFEWRAEDRGKPLVLRTSLAEGIEVFADVKATLTAQTFASVSFEWVEV